jgi:hypothetical protein
MVLLLRLALLRPALLHWLPASGRLAWLAWLRWWMLPALLPAWGLRAASPQA